MSAGFQPAGTFTKQKRHLQTGAAASQMLAIDRQMQELLSKMQRHNTLIGARHLQEAKDVHTLQHPAASGDFGGISFSSDLQSKLDTSLAQVYQIITVCKHFITLCQYGVFVHIHGCPLLQC